ncbi:MAG: hypothetical protein DI551_00775 [Micavibrio aeruginosavorus]|uniref:Uncharacterized protein n=1 Tax=Micavibrio aeruginosavorus TaxID=349221 RepID=A0A2W5PVR2_9BACT|nr:MAG: hypothetical protein DI551_00775 [Micavibrio aeruginosavorus]
MTDQVPENNRRSRYVVTNPAGQTVFDIGFPVSKVYDQNGLEVSPVAVYVDSQRTQYFSWDVVNQVVALDAPAPKDAIVVIEGDRLVKRSKGYSPRSVLQSALINADMNAAVQVSQELRRDLSRALVLNKSDLDTIDPQLPANAAGRTLMMTGTGFAIGPAVETIVNAEAVLQQTGDYAASAGGSAYVANQAYQATLAIQTSLESLLENLDLGISSANDQVFVPPAFTAGTTTELVLTGGSYPANEQGLTIFFYGTIGNGVSPAPDTYSYDAGLHKIALAAPIPAGTTKVVVKWWNYLIQGVPGDHSVNWMSTIIDAPPLSIAGWDAAGKSVQYQLVTAISGAPTDAEIPTAKAVADHVAAAAPAGPFTAMYESPLQTITSGGSLNLEHLLGGAPRLVQLYIVCQTAEEGYLPGDIIFINPHYQTASSYSQGASVVPNATHIFIRYASTSNAFAAMNKNTGVRANLTNNRWKFGAILWR